MGEGGGNGISRGVGGRGVLAEKLRWKLTKLSLVRKIDMKR